MRTEISTNNNESNSEKEAARTENHRDDKQTIPRKKEAI